MVTSVVSLAAAVYFASLYYARAGTFAETQLSTRLRRCSDRIRRGLRADLYCGGKIGSSAIRLLQIAHLSQAG